MNIKTTKRMSCILLCLFMLLADCKMTVLAMEEPKNEFGTDINGYKYYIDEKTGEPHTGWLLVDGLWYYFNTEGIMQTGWKFISGSWYYLLNDGSMATGWLCDGGIWYYLGQEHDGAMKTGWVKVDGTWYFFDGSGAMQTGWLYQNGVWYYLGNPGDGAMKTDWHMVNGVWYYFNDNGSMKTGWLCYNGKWYYFMPSGAMAKRYANVDGKSYLFDCAGVMWQPGVYDAKNFRTIINHDGSVLSSYTSWFPVVYQKPELPTGCEITALTMVLQYYGFPASKITMARDYLPKVVNNYKGVDLDYYFGGNPFGGGTICGAGALVTAANEYLADCGSSLRGYDLTGTSVNDLYAYVSTGTPVVIMATIGMADRRTPQGWYTSEGKYVDWSTNDHGLVLIGWDATTVTVACPIYGIKKYSKVQFEKVFASRGNRAMILK